MFNPNTATALDTINQAAIEASQRTGGRWVTPPMASDENGTPYQPPDVWVRA